jgi:ribosome-binding protein aMBF1 (putative translation factor)
MVVISRREQRRATNFDDFLAEQLRNDPEFAFEYHKIGPRYDAAIRLIKSRRRLGLTQTDLAKRMKVHPHVVSRLESAQHSPRLDTLALAAIAMGYELQVRFAKKRATKAPARKAAGLRKKSA